MKRHGPPSDSGPGADKLKVARRRFHTGSHAGRARRNHSRRLDRFSRLASECDATGAACAMRILRYEDIVLESPWEGLEASGLAISLNFNFAGKGRALRIFCFQGAGHA
jgi:hypothetical protein